MASNYSSFCSLGFTLRAARLLLENPRGRMNWRTRHKSRLPIFICLRPSPPIFMQKRDWSCRQSMACSIRKAFYTYIETCTLFFHTYHVFFSLNIKSKNLLWVKTTSSHFNIFYMASCLFDNVREFLKFYLLQEKRKLPFWTFFFSHPKWIVSIKRQWN